MNTNNQNKLDHKYCPKCGLKNHCAVENQKDLNQCWCMKIHVSNDFQSHLSKVYKNQGCLCQSCLEEEMINYKSSNIKMSK
jgi:hypothetical protein